MKVFISHSWNHHRRHFDRLVSKLTSQTDIHLSIHSVEEHDPIFLENSGVARNIKEQIRASNVFVCINTPAITYSEWLRYEVDTAAKLAKPIIAVTPHGLTGTLKKSRFLDRYDVSHTAWNTRSVLRSIDDALHPTADSFH
ncbi:MAG: TIR domain-containing protein [Hyphomicrobiales bacterium]|nr:TIR domain-containing protein [Hyphomicrobiales bacterium]